MRWFFLCLISVGFLVVSPAKATTIDWRQVNDAKAGVQSAPLNADAWLNLAVAYHQIIELHRDKSLPTIVQAWRNAEHRSLQLRYGTMTEPRTLQEALELAQVYTNNWQPSCHGVSQCFDETELDLLRALSVSVASRTWDLSLPAEAKAATEWNRRAQNWNHDWADAGLELKLITRTRPVVRGSAPLPDDSVAANASPSFLTPKKIFWTCLVVAFVLIAGIILFWPRAR